MSAAPADECARYSHGSFFGTVNYISFYTPRNHVSITLVPHSFFIVSSPNISVLDVLNSYQHHGQHYIRRM